MVTYSPRGAQRHGPQSAMPGRVNPVPPIRELGGPGGRRRQREDRMREQECRIPLRSGRTSGEGARQGQVSQMAKAVRGFGGIRVTLWLLPSLLPMWPSHPLTRPAHLPHTRFERTGHKSSPQGWGDNGREGRYTYSVLPTLSGRGPVTQQHGLGTAGWW